MFFYFSYLKFELLLWNIELIFMFWHVFVVNGNTGKGTHASAVGSFILTIWLLVTMETISYCLIDV